MGELAEALEMSDDMEDINGDARTLIIRWQKEMKLLKSPIRPHLMYHLTKIGMKHLLKRFLFYGYF